MPRRILYIEANEDGTVGGSHQSLFDLVTGLDRKDFEPLVLFYQANHFIPRLEEAGVSTIDWEPVRRREISAREEGNLPRKSADILWSVVRRLQLLRRHQIDLVHINNSPAVGNDDWLPATKLLRIPCVASVRGIPDGIGGPIQRWLARAFDAVVAVSEHMRDVMIRHDIPPSRVHLIYNGIDLEAVRDSVRRRRTEVLVSLDIDPGKVVIAMVGTVRRWKGQHVVVEAASLLPDDIRKRSTLLFVGPTGPGDREYRASLEEAIERYSLGDFVRFLGERDDVPELFAAADVAVHASIMPEPFGLVLVEAMAVGTPVVAADQGGPTEIFSSAEEGLTYDVDDPAELAGLLTRLVRDESFRERIAGNGKRRAEEFDISRTRREVQELYRELLAP